jgi:hypothetical protein
MPIQMRVGSIRRQNSRFPEPLRSVPADQSLERRFLPPGAPPRLPEDCGPVRFVPEPDGLPL